MQLSYTWRRGALASLILTVLSVSGAPAAADMPPEVLRDARRHLVRYDPAGGTVAVIRNLTAYLPRADGADRREARFLRAVAGTDLLLLAYDQHREARRAELAAALGTTSEQLEVYLDQELASLDLGVYAEQASECRWVLDRLRHPRRDPEVLRAGRGLRRDVLYVGAVVRALGHENPVADLVPFGVDPCAGDEVDRCALGGFPAEGRRAIDALLEAERALLRLEEVHARGEPLTSSLAGLVAVDGAVLRLTEINPVPRLPSQAHGVGGRGPAVHPDLVLVVGAGEVRYAYVPRVRVRGGQVDVRASGTPTLPETARLPFRLDGRSGMAPFEDLSARVERLLAEHPVAHIAVAGRSDLESHVMARVLVTLHRAGVEDPLLVHRGVDGEVRGIPTRLIMGDEVRSQLNLFVRVGGYTLRRGPRVDAIPRVRDARGLHFDLRALEARSRSYGSMRTAVSFMSTVRWGEVVDAAFHLETPQGPLALVLY